MQEKAKSLIIDWYKHAGKEITQDDVYVVWFCKTLQNWKCLVSTTVPDGLYFEVTHNGARNETYVDVYKKCENCCSKG